MKHRTGTHDELLAASKKILDREQELGRGLVRHHDTYKLTTAGSRRRR